MLIQVKSRCAALATRARRNPKLSALFVMAADEAISGILGHPAGSESLDSIESQAAIRAPGGSGYLKFSQCIGSVPPLFSSMRAANQTIHDLMWTSGLGLAQMNRGW